MVKAGQSILVLKRLCDNKVLEDIEKRLNKVKTLRQINVF
jgi:hypothetical protein